MNDMSMKKDRAEAAEAISEIFTGASCIDERFNARVEAILRQREKTAMESILRAATESVLQDARRKSMVRPGTSIDEGLQLIDIDALLDD